MAGSSMVFSYDDGDGSTARVGIRRIVCAFTTDDTDGSATGTTKKIAGELIKVTTDPGATAPSANWDVVITDPEGINVCTVCQNAAALIARHTTNTEETYLYLKNTDATPIGIASYPVVCDALTIAVANGGNSKVGEIILYYRA